MIVYHALEFENSSPRAHPWSVAESDEVHRYYDFKRDPSLIPMVLEDFKSLSAHAAIQEFYSLLAWLNVDSALESNDCAFRGPHANETDRQFPFPVKCSGRVMVLFKDIEENTQDKSINWLCSALQTALAAHEPNLMAGAVGISRLPVAYKDLGPKPGQAGLGKEVMLSFWAYGETDSSTMGALEKVVSGMDAALRIADSRIRAGEVRALYA